MFYFNWIDETTVYDPLTHHAQAIDIFDLKIIEAETLYPTAIITVQGTPALWQQLKVQSWALIIYDDGRVKQQLFKGCLNSFPLNFKGQAVTLEFIAKPSNATHQFETIKKHLIANHTYDPCLYAHLYDISQAEVSELLDQSCHLIDWHRTPAHHSFNIIQWE